MCSLASFCHVQKNIDPELQYGTRARFKNICIETTTKTTKTTQKQQRKHQLKNINAFQLKISSQRDETLVALLKESHFRYISKEE